MCADDAARLRDEVSSSNAQIQQMHADLQAWEQAVSSRDTELRNLQVGTIQVFPPRSSSSVHPPPPPPFPLAVPSSRRMQPDSSFKAGPFASKLQCQPERAGSHARTPDPVPFTRSESGMYESMITLIVYFWITMSHLRDCCDRA